MPTSARRLPPRFRASLLLLLPLGWPGAAAADDSAAVDQAKRTASSIFQSCHSMAATHAEVLSQANAMSNGGRQEGLENLAEEAERVYLATYQGGISDATNQISRLEEDLRNLPPEQQTVVPMESVTGMCRLASEPVGAAGLSQLRLDIISYRQSFGSLRSGSSFGSTSGSRGGGAWPSGKETTTAMPAPRLRPNEKPLTAAEFEDRKEKWAARQQEEELRQQRELQLRQEALDASRQEKKGEQLPEAKVSVRSELLPSGPNRTPEQTALLPKMKGWHETYSDNIKPFKMALSQLMAVPASRAYARREACKSVWTAVDALNRTGVLKQSPDAAVVAPGVAMGAKFQQAVDACLMGNNRDMDRLMKEAEQELGKMAAALVPYSLSP